MKVVNIIIMNFHMQSSVLRSDMITTVGERNLKHDEEIELKKNPFEPMGVSVNHNLLTP